MEDLYERNQQRPSRSPGWCTENRWSCGVMLSLAQAYWLHCCSPSERLQLRFLSGASDGHSQLPPTKIPQQKPTQTRVTCPQHRESRVIFGGLQAPAGSLLPTGRQAACLSAACLLLCWLSSTMTVEDMESAELFDGGIRGRGLRATKEISAGDVVFAEPSFSAVVFDRYGANAATVET